MHKDMVYYLLALLAIVLLILFMGHAYNKARLDLSWYQTEGMPTSLEQPEGGL